jgi:hypothetical protein
MKHPYYQAFSSTIRMFGTKPLWEADRLEAMLTVLESFSAFAPQFWSRDERTKKPYSREEILVDRKPLSIKKHLGFYLKRQQAPKYFGTFNTGVCPSFDIEIDAGLPPKHWSAFYELADKLARVFEPDVANTNIGVARSYTDPTEENKRWSLMMSSPRLLSVDYQHTGLKGLALRTHLGPHYINQIGRELLLSTPGVTIEEQAWGGMRIDLGPEPWMLLPDDMLTRWETAMIHLRPTGVFASYEMFDIKYLYYKFFRGPNCTVGNRVPWDRIPEEIRQTIGYHNAHLYPGGGEKPNS